MLNNLGPCPAQRDGIVIVTTVHVGTAVGRYTDRKLGLADMPSAVQLDSVKNPVDGQWKHVCWNAGGNGYFLLRRQLVGVVFGEGEFPRLTLWPPFLSQ